MTPTIIALTGPAGAGKDTAAWRMVTGYGFARFAFADPVRDAALAFLDAAGIDHAYLTERHLKEQPLPGPVFGDLQISARRLLQVLGTECGRNLAPDLWVRILALRAGLYTTPVHDRIVITDVRFPNELDALRGWGAHIVAITRSRLAPVAQHSSEAHFAELHAQADTAMVNDGSLHHLERLVDGLMDSLSISRRASGDLWAEINA